MVKQQTINIGRAVLSAIAVITVAFGLAILGLAHDIKKATPPEAVQVVLYFLGVMVVLTMATALLTMAHRPILLKIFGGAQAVTLLASIIIVICVKLREDDVLNSVAKLPAEGDPAPASAERLELRHRTHEALQWGIPIIIVACILQTGVIVFVGISWYLTENAGTPEERRARAEAEKNRRVAKIAADVQMSSRQNMYKADKKENEVLRAHMEKAYGAHTHGDAWKKEERKKWLGIF